MSKHSVNIIEQACKVMHDAYEAAAVTAGWETQQRSCKPWADVPEANRETMRTAVAALLDWLANENGSAWARGFMTADQDADPIEVARMNPYQP